MQDLLSYTMACICHGCLCDLVDSLPAPDGFQWLLIGLEGACWAFCIYLLIYGKKAKSPKVEDQTDSDPKPGKDKPSPKDERSGGEERSSLRVSL
jgi:hypothetical protein